MGFCLAGCARPVGDFGRARPDVLHDKLMPAMGDARARIAKEPVSDFNLTDEEVVMRDRVWRFLVAPHTADWFMNIVTEWQRTRLIDAQDQEFATTRYYEHLAGQEFRSSTTRYRKLQTDIEIDSAMLPDAYTAICRVIEIDRQRDVSVHVVNSATDEDRENVRARKFENDRFIDWFVRAVDYRTNSYSLALEKLLVETPNVEAREVDKRLFELSNRARHAKNRDFCSGDGPAEVMTPRQKVLPGREFIFQK